MNKSRYFVTAVFISLLLAAIIILSPLDVDAGYPAPGTGTPMPYPIVTATAVTVPTATQTPVGTLIPTAIGVSRIRGSHSGVATAVAIFFTLVAVPTAIIIRKINARSLL